MSRPSWSTLMKEWNTEMIALVLIQSDYLKQKTNKNPHILLDMMFKNRNWPPWKNDNTIDFILFDLGWLWTNSCTWLHFSVALIMTHMKHAADGFLLLIPAQSTSSWCWCSFVALHFIFLFFLHRHHRPSAWEYVGPGRKKKWFEHLTRAVNLFRKRFNKDFVTERTVVLNVDHMLHYGAFTLCFYLLSCSWSSNPEVANVPN